MYQFLNYYARFQGVRGQVGGLPAWARFVLGVVAFPAIVLAGLSILAFLVSLLALLLLTAPVYRLLQFVTGTGQYRDANEQRVSEPASPMGEPSPGRRHIDVTIIE